MKLLSTFFIFSFCLLIDLSYQLTCATGTGTFYFEMTDKCEKCSNGCNICTGFHESQCSACKSGFNKIQIDNQFYCSQCTKGFYYDTTQSTCVKCGTDCDMCFSSDTCLICKVGYVYNTAYKNCDTVKCDYGYYRNYLTNTCDTCPATMESCSSTAVKDSTNTIVGNTITALQCKTTLQLYNGSCACQYATYLLNNVCKPCADSNCTYCSSSACNTCKEGYYNQDGKCVLICQQATYYVTWGTPYVYNCYSYLNSSYKITMINKLYYCNEYLGYQDGRGCFTQCRPHEFKLYNPSTNSYRCVTNCPQDYTLDFQYMMCVKHDCTNDITYKSGGTCFFRVCKLGTFFQDFISHSQKSICQNNYSSCINQAEESSYCVQCNPQYLNSYSSGTCVLTCTNTNYYFSFNSCSTCSYSTNIPNCLSNNRKISFTQGTQQYLGVNKCPEGYTLTGTVCTKCTDPMLINCEATMIQYVCEWGNNNQVKTCDPHDLLSLSTSNKGFDVQGSVVSIGTSGCKIKNADGTCKICGSSYNYNFKGTCSQKFARATKYYFYYNNTDSQYQVLDTCLPTQYVSRSGSSGIRLCKDFAYCGEYITQPVNGVSTVLCTKCPKYYFNLNGNCIENCPSYTYKNATAANCTTPIDNCATYSSSTTPTCSTCRQSFVRYKSGSLCIPISTCINGLYFNLTQNYCLTCPTGCSICDSTNRCLTPSTGYYLHNYQAVSTCPVGYFKPPTGNTCLKCSQFCLTCTNQNTCTVPYNGLSYYYLKTNKVFYYVSPICKTNEYYDATLNKCMLCNLSCSQCITTSTFCTMCADTNLALLNGTCVVPCPDGYYQTQWITASLNRKVCSKCDASCSTCTSQTNCLTCSIGYSFYHNTCLKTCPALYVSIKQQCYLKCNQYFFNPDPDHCEVCKPECLTCKSATSCSLCKSPQFVQEGQCVDDCILPFFKNQENNACIRCVNSCEVCVVINDQSTCTQCKDGFVLDPINNDCLPCDSSCSQCYNTQTSCLLCSNDAQVILNSTCMDSCPSGYYQTTEITTDYTREVCKACDPSCLNLKCFSQSTTCIEGCSANFYGYQNKCLSQCPPGYEIVGQLCQLICLQGYYNIDQYTCAPCKSECLECDNGNSCINCQSLLFFYDGQCLESCSLPYFEDIDKMQCIKCGSDQCVECQVDNSVATCKLCEDTFILDSTNNTCIACGLQEYSDPILNQCIPCDSSCNKCFEKSTNCMYCANSQQTLLNNKCLDACPSGYFQSSEIFDNQSRNICNQCDHGCLDSICKNEATFCVTGCSEGLYFYHNKCLKECPEGYEVREQKCYKICQNSEYNQDQDICLPCMQECDKCSNGKSCNSCKKPLILLDELCVESCQIPFFHNEELNECINCGSKSCIECSFEEASGTCTKCKEGYALNELKRCIQQENDEKPQTKDEAEEAQYINEPITYQGKILEGEECHYSCKQCKGSGPDECLSCYLSTRVFFEQKYCLCADGYEEDGNQKCSLQDQNLMKVGEYIDLIINFFILLAVACDKIPVLTLVLVDIMQIGSYQIYLEQIYNYVGKLPVFKAIYQSNYSKMILNVLMKKYDVDVGVYKTKKIIQASNGDMEKELPIIFNDISTEYILNSLPYLCILALSLLILLVLRFKNLERYQVFLNKYLVIFYYLTFQDQILFIGLQIKYLSMDSSLSKVSLVFLGVAGIFNIFMVIRVLMLTKQSYSIPFKQSEQFKILYLYHSYFIGLLLKLINSLSVVLTPLNIRIYIFSGVLGATLFFQLFLAIKNLKIQSKLFFIGRILIALEVSIFAFTILFNEPHIAEKFVNDNNLHLIQKTLNTLLLFEKVGLFSLELLLVVIKNNLYNYKAGLSTYTERMTQQDSLMSQNNSDVPFNFELEQYQQIQKLGYIKKE